MRALELSMSQSAYETLCRRSVQDKVRSLQFTVRHPIADDASRCAAGTTCFFFAQPYGKDEAAKSSCSPPARCSECEQ